MAEQDPYTELAARLGVDRAEAKRLLLGAAYDVESFDAEKIKRITGSDPITVQRLPNGEDLTVRWETFYAYADVVDGSRLGKGAFLELVERLALDAGDGQ